MSDTLNMDRVVTLVQAAGVEAYVEQTGGGTATIYAGPTREEDGWGARYAAVAGPGWFEGPGWTLARGHVEDFYVGPDDYGDVTPIVVHEVGARTDEQVAALIVAQARLADPTTVLGADDVDALGLDSTGRS